MTILDKSVIIKWWPTNRKHLESKGYSFVAYREEIEVLICDLTPKSAVNITAVCVKCGKIRELKFCHYNEKCRKCSNARRSNVVNPEKAERLILKNDTTINSTDKFALTVWAGSTKKYYESLGYVYTKLGDQLMVQVSHLPKNSAVKINAVCITCSKIRLINFYQYSDYCVKCSNENLRKNPDYLEKISKIASENAIKRNKENIGEKHPRWNPDRSYKERELHRGNPVYRKWAVDVKARDNYTCQVCSKYGERICSHHLMSYLSYPDLRFDIDNGVCLCLACHRGFHSKYGNKNNTKFQFEEFSFYARLNNIISIDSYTK